MEEIAHAISDPVPGEPLRFHFDFVSPYSYLAWTQIHAIAERHGRAVEIVPVLFAGLLNHQGTKGPAEVAAKRRYLLFDTVRKARTLGVPFGPPLHHPFNPLLALRVASAPMDAATRRALRRRGRTRCTELAGGRAVGGKEGAPQGPDGTPTLDRDALARWAALTPSAVRKRANP